MSKAFKIMPGKFTIPQVGYVDSREEVSDDKAFAIYKLPRRVFPWIELGPEAESYLRKQRLKAEEVGRLILNARTPEEVEFLANLSDTKRVARIKETRLKAFNQTTN